MLMALLYSNDGQILAAAPACDQVPYGDDYWMEFHAAELDSADVFETAYVTVANPETRSRLLLVGIDESVDAIELLHELDQVVAPNYVPGRAA
jgi:hypothetical protein